MTQELSDSINKRLRETKFVQVTTYVAFIDVVVCFRTVDRNTNSSVTKFVGVF